MTSRRPPRLGSAASDSPSSPSRIVLRSLFPLSAGLSVVYVVFAVSHLLTLPRSAAVVLSPLAASTALLLFGLAILLRRRSIPSRWAHPLGAAVAGLVLLNSLVHLSLTIQLRRTTSLLLLIVGAGSLSLSTAWFASVVASALVGWSAVVLLHPSLPAGSPSAVSHFAIALLSAAALGALTHTLRVRTLNRVRQLHSRERNRKEELEAALAAARESEERYHDLLDSANDLVQSIAPDGSILYVNRAWRETLGYDDEALSTISILDVIHPDSHEQCRAVLRRLAAGASAERLRTTLVTREGQEIIVEGTVNCRFEDGVPVSVRGIFRDVSERVRAEHALHCRNRELTARNAVAEVLAGSTDLDQLLNEALLTTVRTLGFTGGLITLADQQTERLQLVSHVGLSESLVRYLETRGLEGTLCHAVYRTGRPMEIEDLSQGRPEKVAGLLRQGLRSYAGAPVIHKGRITGTFCLFSDACGSLTESDRDLLTAIGQQIGVAVENARLFDQSRTRRLYLEAVLSAAPDAIITLDQNHQIVEWNAGAERLFGYASDEVVGKDLDPLIAAPGVLDQATGFTRTVMRGEKLSPLEAVRYRKDGSPVNVLLAGSPFLIGGEFGGAVAVYTDISELKKAQQALRRYAAELEARNEELDAFAHTVAHDLKNPLQHLVGYADLLADDYDGLPADIRQEALHTIIATADRMRDIIGELLLLAEVRRGEVTMKPLDMAAIVASARACLGYLINQHDGEIVGPETWPTVLGHAAWIEEVWANYLSNAIKYGGRPPRVEIGADPDANGSVRFWVRDNGQGLTEDEQTSLFTPFTRLHRINGQGHGLGLSIVRRIMDKLGGQVGVESETGKGTTFYFTLPQT